MLGKINKFMLLCDFIYHIILLNTLFLITNSLFFQLYFFVDFQVIFFPLYFIGSITLIPSLLALLRSWHKIRVGDSDRLMTTYFHEFLFSLRNEYKLWGTLQIAVFMTLTALYVLPVTNLMTGIIYALNLMLLVSEGLFSMNLLRNGLSKRKKLLLKGTIISFLPEAMKNTLILFSIPLVLFGALQLSYIMIIFIFGILLEALYWGFTDRRKENK